MPEPQRKPPFPNRPNSSNFIIVIIASLIIFLVFIFLSENPSRKKELAYSEFLKYVDGVYDIKTDTGSLEARFDRETQTALLFLKENGTVFSLEKKPGYKTQIRQKIKVQQVVFRNRRKIEGTYTLNDGSRDSSVIKFVTIVPLSDPFLLKKLEARGVRIQAKLEDNEGGIFSSFYIWIPLILLIAVVWFLFLRPMQNSNNKAFSFNKSRAKLYKTGGKKVLFSEVAGVEEAKEELEEMVEFLKNPEKFQKMGARIPKGALLVGPPGTGKTLLARAVAGEANRPFYSISGSEFVEMFVGVGASRVRDLFDNAKKDSPCIIFIDELDAVGRKRGAGLGGGNDEREQTLNQILVEMDGFDNKTTVIVLAATNRPDILDKALLRPGRFDRQVIVGMPDLQGREKIFEIHTKGKPLAEDIDLKVLSRGTPGFSGADIENMVNEAILLAARKGKEIVEIEDFEEARDKKLMGPARKSRVMSDHELENTAFHEAGHTIVAHMLEETDPLHKVTIIPRGQALGVTQQLPEADKYSYSKTYILNRVSILMAGRIAEEYRFGEDSVTTGASNDIKVATQMIHNYVCTYGMSEKIGPVAYGQDEGPVFIGEQFGKMKDYSEETAREIDLEIKKIIEDQYQIAKNIIYNNKEKLNTLSYALLKKETLDLKEIEEILGKKIRKEENKEAVENVNISPANEADKKEEEE